MLVQGSGFKPYLSTTHLSPVLGSQSSSLVDVGGCLYGLIRPVVLLCGLRVGIFVYVSFISPIKVVSRSLCNVSVLFLPTELYSVYSSVHL